MVKWCVHADLRFDSEAKRDAIVSHAKDLIRGRPVWREIIEEGEIISQFDPYDGMPLMVIMVKFDMESDMRDVLQKVKAKLQTVSGVHGSVIIYRCRHDEPHPRRCVIEREFTI